MFLALFWLDFVIMTYSLYVSMCVQGGVIWGIRVPASRRGQISRIISWVLLILSIAAFAALVVPTARSALALAMSNILFLIIYIAVFAGTIYLTAWIAQKLTLHSTKRDKNAAILGELPFVKSVESQMDQAHAFIVSFEGIALVNQMNYCFAVERYEDYQMGSLTSPKEVALIGMYFLQKHHKQFRFKLDMEVIPGEPGQLVTAVGSGGINVAYVHGTKDKRIFRSYIFTRK